MIYSLDGLMIGDRSAPRDRRPLARKMFEECEHLARALAGGTVTLNIVPATGPVTAGGDQGRDFETYRTELPGQVQSLGRDIGLRDTDCAGPAARCSRRTSKMGADTASIVARRTALAAGVRGRRLGRGCGRGTGEGTDAVKGPGVGTGTVRSGRPVLRGRARPARESRRLRLPPGVALALLHRREASAGLGVVKQYRRPALPHRRGLDAPTIAQATMAPTARTGRHRPVHDGGSPSGHARS